MTQTAARPRRRTAKKPPVWVSYAAGTDADYFADWCEASLVQWVDDWAGMPLTLEAWQREVFADALAYDQNGLPIWNSVVICVPRKNGKTMMLAALAVYKLLEDSDGSPEILLAASTDKQDRKSTRLNSSHRL